MVPAVESTVMGVEIMVLGVEIMVLGVEGVFPGMESVVPGVGSMVLGVEGVFPGVESVVPGVESVVLGVEIEDRMPFKNSLMDQFLRIEMEENVDFTNTKAMLLQLKYPPAGQMRIFLTMEILCLFLWPVLSAAQPVSNRIVIANFRSINLGNIVPNEIIAKVRPGISEAQINGLLSRYGIRRIEGNIRTGTQRILVPSRNVFEVAALLNLEPLIEYAEPNYLVRGEFIPNDPYYKYQWNFPLIDMELAWDLSIGANVIVAVIDTGIAFENQGLYALAPDLAGTAFMPGWDFVNDDAFPDDDNGHGTHIAGTIAQTTHNLLGVAGIAYGSTLMPVKVLDSATNGLISDIADGIYFAVNNGAQIINISFGTYTASLTLENAVSYAYANGVSVITSAGNNATSIPHYPSSYPGCVCVTAVRYDLVRPFYANYGTDIDICAPGGDLSRDQNLDGQPDGICQQTHNGTSFTTFEYALYQGTSCAAAHVSGVAALVLSAAGGILTPDELRSALQTTAVDLGVAGWDQDFGWGLVNALNAVRAVQPTAALASLGPFVPFSLTLPLWSPISLFSLSMPLYQQIISPFSVAPFGSAAAQLASSESLGNFFSPTRQAAASANFISFYEAGRNPLFSLLNPQAGFDFLRAPYSGYFQPLLPFVLYGGGY